MSNYKCTIKVKKTGEVKEVCAYDNYYGGHQYGYIDEKEDLQRAYREDEIEIINQ